MPRRFTRTPIAALGLTATTVLLLSTQVQAYQPAAHLTGHDGLERADQRGVRLQRLLNTKGPTTAAGSTGWQRFQDDLGSAWALWDPATGVPSRIIPSGVRIPGVVASPSRANSEARQLLDRHVRLLAPGSGPTDFVLVANHESHGIRTLGYQQLHHGMEVIGGQVSFRFKGDHLSLVGSEALPGIHVSPPATLIDEETAGANALAFIAGDILGRPILEPGVDGPFVLPLVDRSGPEFRVVVRVEVAVSGPPSRWNVYLDAQTGAPVAREQTLRFAEGQVVHRVYERSPSFGPQIDLPAAFVEQLVDGQPQIADQTGAVTFPGPQAAVTTGLSGPLGEITDPQAPVGSTMLDVADGGTGVWATQEEFIDAQLASYAHGMLVKEHVRQHAPDVAWLDTQLPIQVNIESVCNAFSDGNSINFFMADDVCENTGRMSDVIYHEFGHSIHSQSIIPGVGAFEGALSEGISDYLAATLVDDSSMARGFFFTEDPLRELDPPDIEWTWPDDFGEVHFQGQIIGGALWDLRELLIDKHGYDEGTFTSDRLWMESIRRAVDIPTMYPEVLLADDDDGDLSNGTPNVCEIVEAFGAHGLYAVPPKNTDLSFIDDGDLFRVDLALDHEFEGCPVSSQPVLRWKLRGQEQIEELEMVEGAPDEWRAFIPKPAEGSVLQYQLAIEHSVGAVQTLPDNLADQWYEHFVGAVEPLYCTSFEALADWEEWDPVGFDWQWAVPQGLSGDPEDAFSGMNVVGNDLGTDGLYLADSAPTLRSPIVDTLGFDNVRLQYRRWLNVEDGFFDQATITANGIEMWTNFAAPDDIEAHRHHTDREWRFHDVDVTSAVQDGQVQIGFGLSSDGGLELGGWTIDELCVVGYGGAVAPVCGDGQLGLGEECDDGNELDGDGCSATCETEEDGETGGEDDTGGDEETGGIGDDYELYGRGCGCSTGNGPGAPAGAGLALLGLLALRRRRTFFN